MVVAIPLLVLYYECTMNYIKNPFGRLVEVPDDRPIDEKTGLPSKKSLSEYEQWLLTPGYSVPTGEEIQEYIADQTAKVEGWKKDEERNKKIYGKNGVYFVTVSQGGKDGYAVASKNIFKELQNLNVPISFTNEGQKIALLLHAPHSITRLESPIRLLFTMFESTKIPDEWLDYLEQADRIIVPSKWNAEVFAQSGFDKVDVVPLGYDDEVFKFIDRPIRRDRNENFTFLHFNAFNVRKGFLEVFKAFVSEFRPDEPVRMIFKTTLQKAPLPIMPDKYPNIEVITAESSEEELLKIMARSDAFVFPSRGEGFGMTPLEAMATGLPTIVPNAHGITEYFNADFMYECKVGEMCPALYSRYKDQDVGKMFVTDVKDLRRQMRYIYEHQTEAKAKGQAAAFYVKNWTFKKTAEKLKVIINEMSSKPEVQKPLRNTLRLEQIRG